MIYDKLYQYADESNSDYSRFSDITYNASLKDSNENGVRISTIHKAKGLEWKIVFIFGSFEENYSQDLSVDEEDNEEKNILYIGITRAKDELIILYPKRKENEYIKLLSFLLFMLK